MRRVAGWEAAPILGWATTTFAKWCRRERFPSAKQDQPRGGWSILECCLNAELAKTTCGVCTGEEAPPPPEPRYVEERSPKGVAMKLEGFVTRSMGEEELLEARAVLAQQLLAIVRQLQPRTVNVWSPLGVSVRRQAS